MAKKKNRQQDPDESSDSGGPTESASVASGCSHIAKAVDLGTLKKKLKGGVNIGCLTCAKQKGNVNKNTNSEPDSSKTEESSDENVRLWMCLKCGEIGCGREQQKHALEHFKVPRSDVHAMVVDVESWTVWCYVCETEMAMNSTRKLLECIEYVKRHLQSSSTLTSNGGESTQRSALNAPTTAATEMSGETTTITGVKMITGIVGDYQAKTSKPKCLQKVRGLMNLGNTCFYNSVLQCLSVTPFLAPVLQCLTKTGEKFSLPGDPSNKDVDEIPVIEGELGESGQVTSAFLTLLTQMQSPTLPQDTLRPMDLLKRLQERFSQFEGHDQHDSHELLRHLLEAVRAEDLKRYQRVVLEHQGLYGKVKASNDVTGTVRKKIKLYGQQIQDLTLGVEGIFKGQLVSILECQDCLNVSVRSENFLDLSLPVAEDKRLPPMRKKDSGDNNSTDVPSKAQLKKQKMEAKMLAKKHKLELRKQKADVRLASFNGRGSDEVGPDNTPTITEENANEQNEDESEQSDADVEDNAEQDSVDTANGREVEESGYSSDKQQTGESDRTSPAEKEVVSDCAWAEFYTPIHTNSNNNDGPPALSQVEDTSYSKLHTPDHRDDNLKTNPVEEFCDADLPDLERPESRCEFSPIGGTGCAPNHAGSPLLSVEDRLMGLTLSGSSATNEAESSIDVAPPESKLVVDHDSAGDTKKDSASWCKTMASRQQTEEGECSVISCLNQFTSLELMTNNNKAGCDACTQRQNKGKDGKTVYTNSTKQLLISSPPAVLILHLKRFMMENFRFKKLQRFVSFPVELDLAPFCSNKCKDLPSVAADQTEVLYRLFGVVEHSGTLNAGHYVAYIKVRPSLGENDPRWSFLPKTREFVYPKLFNGSLDSQDSAAASESDEKWYNISDSRVVETNEAKVLKTQAYLLFYERVK